MVSFLICACLLVPLQALRLRLAARPDEDMSSLAYSWYVPDLSPTHQGPPTLHVPDGTARRLAGPLTLLNVLQTCKATEQVEQAIHRARERKELRLHITGSGSSVEPVMAWAGVLKGWNATHPSGNSQLPDTTKRLMDMMGVTSPFEDLRLNIVINGYGLFDSSISEPIARREAINAGWDNDAVSIRFVNGTYEKAIETLGEGPPDIAVALNAGLDNDPIHWAGALVYLRSHGVLTLATDYGAEVVNDSSSGLARSEGPETLVLRQTEKKSAGCAQDLVPGAQADSLVVKALGGRLLAQWDNNPFFWVDQVESRGPANDHILLFSWDDSSSSQKQIMDGTELTRAYLLAKMDEKMVELDESDPCFHIYESAKEEIRAASNFNSAQGKGDDWLAEHDVKAWKCADNIQ